MKLVRIYSADESKFHNIEFNSGFNVIQADIMLREDSAKDTHNLGKSLLIELIDFLLLKQISNKQKFFLTKGRFEGEVYFAEFELNSGKFLVVRREVDRPSKISIKLNKERLAAFTTQLDWDEIDLPLNKAKDILNRHFQFDVASEWFYRKSSTYFLRTQSDFRDVFRLDKFSRGADKNWKPFMFDLLGFDGNLLSVKYEMDDQLESEKQHLAAIEREANVSLGEIDRVRGLIEIKSEEVTKTEERLDKFNFYESDKNINQDLVENLESKIQTLNTRRYSCKFEVEKIKQSLSSVVPEIDVSKLKSLFDEVAIFFPENLEKNFENLNAFNRAIAIERKEILKGNLESLEHELQLLDGSLRSLEEEKQSALQSLTTSDVYSKFKQLQRALAVQQGEIAGLEERISTLTRSNEIIERIEELTWKIKSQISEIEDAIAEQKHAPIRRVFNKLIQEILDTNGLISVRLNKAGNVEFMCEIQNPGSMQQTDEAGGATYKKLMCMAFDLSILITYSEHSFFRFVYHDGALEAVEDRKKLIYAKLVRKICRKYGLQYIMTLIDSDLPMNTDGEVVHFDESDICLRLNDTGDEGKLFKRSF